MPARDGRGLRLRRVQSSCTSSTRNELGGLEGWQRGLQSAPVTPESGQGMTSKQSFVAGVKLNANFRSFVVKILQPQMATLWSPHVQRRTLPAKLQCTLCQVLPPADGKSEAVQTNVHPLDTSFCH